ncbi:DHH family phosphoesterase [Candidatus Woesearchaeota archaeon]|nr:DHH family phosphoesterase [Candidatus Woesearchaeota archaeon]
MPYQEFQDSITGAVAQFHAIPKSETIRVISHLDCDGIAACSIFLKALMRENRQYALSTVQQLNDEVLGNLQQEQYSVVVFTDLGSTSAAAIAARLEGKTVLILDHHEPESSPSHIIHINPHLHSIDGSREISGAGVVYLFCKALNEKNRDMAHIALIGATGDMQESNGFLHLNKAILDDALQQGLVEVRKGLRMFGSYTRPVHKALEYSTDPFVPGVSGSESGAISLLNSLHIPAKNGANWRRLADLTKEETQRLIAAIVMKRISIDRPEDIIGNHYLLLKETLDEFRDMKSFSTVLNACGRLDNSSLGIGCCLGDEKMKRKAVQNLQEYKRQIMQAMRWYESHQDSPAIIRHDGYLIINAGDHILSTMAGTMASILSRSGTIPDGTLILSLAHQDAANTKVSLRIAGQNRGNDLMSIIKQIASRVGCDAGGHKDAAGTLIKIGQEEAFIAAAQEIFQRLSMEEKIA